MFEGLKRKLAIQILWAALKSLATSKNTQTTIAGILASAAIAVPGFSLDKLLAGDRAVIAHTIAVLPVALIGIWNTRARRDGHTTAAGVVAGALYVCSGQITDVITALALALAGYFSNKPVAALPAPEPTP